MKGPRPNDVPAFRAKACKLSLTAIVLFATPLSSTRGAGEEPSSAKGSHSSPSEERHWAFEPVVRPLMPSVKDQGWVRNPIDRFVLAGLEDGELKPSPEADRPTLLRRLSFDLTGLPPTVEEIEAFLADTSPLAYEHVVERLLASPRYGERWAQHWLDIARYADSDGFEFDQARDNAWRYRDWVVQALNQDLPYDVFIRQQIAGDETNPDDPAAFIATGFQRCYPDMVDLNDQGLRRQNALNDITETTGLTFLGLTIGCARCHDHKTDPIRQVDFYQLQAFFSPARFRDDYPVARPDERARHEQNARQWAADVSQWQQMLMRLEAPVRQRWAPGPPKGLNDDVVAAFQKGIRERNPTETGLVYEALQKDPRISPKLWGIALDPTTLHIRQLLLAEISRRLKTPPRSLPTARGLDEEGLAPPLTYLLKRGDYASKGPEVSPGFPPVLCSSTEATRPVTRASQRSSGRRSALAAWLVRPEHPLTARVIANRLWQHHFGRGIVATPSDFGIMGAEPSHPELLDWLAAELVQQRWSLKALHRLMVTSATYRQSSRLDPQALAQDPENAGLWRYRRQRLDGEAIRDSLLFVSGRLNEEVGGAPVFPSLPAELMKLSNKGAVWPVSPDLRQHDRRSLYIFVRRNLRFPFFEAFDRPDTNASCPQRAVTTIAPQALSLMNSHFAVDSARALAQRIEREVATDEKARVRRAYLTALGREPSEQEYQLTHEFLQRTPSLSHLCLAIINTNEFIYID